MRLCHRFITVNTDENFFSAMDASLNMLIDAHLSKWTRRLPYFKQRNIGCKCYEALKDV